MKQGKCEAYYEGCINWGEHGPIYPRGRRRYSVLATLRTGPASFMKMCGHCKQKRLEEYPQLQEHQNKWKAQPIIPITEEQT